MKRSIPLLVVLAGCSLDVPYQGLPGPGLRLITDQLSSPVYAASPSADSTRLFVVEQAGRVRVIRNDTLLGAAFLDLRGKISSGNERGLLSIAFHPDYATNGRFYVYFTNAAGDLRIVRYLRSLNPDVADSLSGDTVLAVAHPGEANHNGGQLQFGPDGMLYAALGDGGGTGDPDSNAQDKHALLGKLLRLDVDTASGYRIPPDNPFVGDTTAEPEIWALGLRNPWRFSIDRVTHDLYIADVGQGQIEEINRADSASGRGANYGWNVMEGQQCYNTVCDTTGYRQPIAQYGHSGGACAVTGGYVYRSTRVFALYGTYLYADYCAGFVRSFRVVNGTATDFLDLTAEIGPGGNISSFGEDARGDVYIVVHGGRLYRIVEAL